MPVALSMNIDLENMDHYFPSLDQCPLADALMLTTSHITMANAMLRESEFEQENQSIDAVTVNAIADFIRQKLAEDRDSLAAKLQDLETTHESYDELMGTIESLDEFIGQIPDRTHGPILDDGPER